MFRYIFAVSLITSALLSAPQSFAKGPSADDIKIDTFITIAQHRRKLENKEQYLAGWKLANDLVLKNAINRKEIFCPSLEHFTVGKKVLAGVLASLGLIATPFTWFSEIIRLDLITISDVIGFNSGYLNLSRDPFYSTKDMIQSSINLSKIVYTPMSDTQCRLITKTLEEAKNSSFDLDVLISENNTKIESTKANEDRAFKEVELTNSPLLKDTYRAVSVNSQ